MTVRILVGNCPDKLRELPAESVHCCVTSPPYWGLRDYGEPGQIGLEETFQEYVAALVMIFRSVRRVLRDDGTLWLNLGDSYSGSGINDGTKNPGLSRAATRSGPKRRPGVAKRYSCPLKPKDLVGIPWRVALALQDDGWWLRSEIIWNKTNPMPENVKDRPSRDHEHIFLLSKSHSYYYDADAIAEAAVGKGNGVKERKFDDDGSKGRIGKGRSYTIPHEGSSTRNARTVWTFPTKPFPGAHFAVFPPELPRRCILAGSPDGGAVLDPFFGAGTTGLVAERLGRDSIGIELGRKYAEMGRDRINGEAPLFSPAMIVEEAP